MELRLEKIDKCYGKNQALSEFNATLTEGVYGLLGPNGAGKTTLISILIGIMDATKGTIMLDGTDIRQMGTKYLERIGYLPQYPLFYKNFRCDEFLSYMCVLKGIPKKEAKARIQEVLELVNLTDASRKKVGALSGGMRQRLGIAQAILNRPNILVLDEPTAGLDPGERIRFRNIISRLAKDKLVLLATHIVSDVESIAKEILILKQGRLIMQGSPEALEARVEGKVWNVLVGEEEVEQWIDTYQVRNVKRQDNGFLLRVVSAERPQGNAEPASASLEDVFLSIFQQESQE
ncbi:ABC transporter ATP-binding protein [Paenibacillus sp. MMS18-CY102]|uniref:ABC transporter ATP-binding protein n=1 Tax=Paenibacillus sp. MMS18-CY102 TaxID=2682849 RepID=UPI001365C3D7|nr:ABC transporter ATP-binding protein [Paenibacillus sp. MMS18-CY102]MWC29500.1 ATP-binding cassette domain-containing protein [Paenibacillus sp. MMS18-CY102]